MQITLSIPGGQAADFQKYYLIRLPVPLDEGEEPIMSASDWIKEKIVEGIYNILRESKQMESFNGIEISIEIT